MMEVPREVETAIEKIASAEGLELVHIEYRRLGREFLLRVDIDKDGGVTLEDCSNMSHQLSAFLDVEADFIPGEYDLQVSSPGLDRKFYKESDYQKFLGRLVRVHSSVPVKGLHVIVGHLTEYTGDRIVVIDPISKKDYPVELKDVKETRLEVEI
jgi:ribosome maturation factor RimP